MSADEPENQQQQQQRSRKSTNNTPQSSPHKPSQMSANLVGNTNNNTNKFTRDSDGNGNGSHDTGMSSKPVTVIRRVSDLDWRLILLLFTTLSLLLLFISTTTTTTTTVNFTSLFQSESSGSARRKDELTRSRIAVCLVGGARRFELTGPSIVERVLKEYPNSDLFLNSPVDGNSFKLSLLKYAPRVASVRVFKPETIQETDEQVRVLTAANSPNGIQGLLQYFNLVEGCLTMIDAYQKEQGFTYDWIIRTRVDGYWSAPLHPRSFIPGQYVIPPGSTYGGLNDRLGVGDYNTSKVALSRLSLIPELDTLNYTGLNSETAFLAQFKARDISFRNPPQPFCIVTDRKYNFPPSQSGVPVAAISSPGPLNGAKCRPCKPVCVGECVADVMVVLSKGWSWTPWSWTPWRNGSLELCDASVGWEVGWEKGFDHAVGALLARFRKKVGNLNVKECVKDFEEMKARAGKWDTTPLEEICKLGLDPE